MSLSGKSNIAVISLSENLGKASAVSYGIKYALENYRSKHYSYLDADLAIPLTELQRLLKIINSSDRIQFIFYSKYKNEKIKHSTKRRIISMILNILVKLTLKINVSDTQCGCKIMSYDIATTLFKEEFISKWLFDVEIFWRLIKKKGYIFFQNHCLEVPLEKFQNQEESKIRLLSLLKLPLDFIYIFKKYK
jgi:dolichyl-phosphate beta-glucosyltransferase